MKQNKNNINSYSALMYHGIDTDKGKFTVSQENFLHQLAYIQTMGYEVTSFQHIRKKYEGRYCVYTFDDGLLSDLWAAEILAESGSKADFFLVKEFLHKDKNRYLVPAMVKRISELGHSIGVHGKSHTWWTDIAPKKLLSELGDTKSYLEDITGNMVTGCSAPGGKINESVAKHIEDSGLFNFIRNSKPVQNSFKHVFVVGSMAIERDCQIKSLHKKITGDPLHLTGLNLAYEVKNIIKSIFKK